jgi:tRNA 2-selenouridine synthase
MGERRPDTADYERLFLEGAPLLDTRAPIEFARGAFPGAVNLPLMTDEERAAVGTCYKERGQAAAIDLGHELVAGSTRQARLDAWADFASQHPDGYLYCFRGGLRSQLVQQWLDESGVLYPRITGGYKAMRRFLIDALETNISRSEFILIAGATGTGKTRAVQAAPRAIDLEGLAKHRGSAFGRLLEEQPTQIDFENALSIELLRLLQTPGPVILEDEGRLIGRIALPESLRARMAESPVLVLEHSLEERIEVVIDDYIVDLGRRFQEQHGEEGPVHHRERLLGDLARTRKRLGGERYSAIAALMEKAFEEQQKTGNVEAHAAWIRRLLEDYYDPMYRYQLQQRAGERLFVGTRDEVLSFARERLTC